MAKVLMVMADDEEKLRLVGSALSSVQRIRILKLLYYNSYNIKEIAEKLDIPPSTTALHIRELEKADLIQTKQQPGKRGSMKICSRKNDYVNIKLSGQASNINQVATASIPIGSYTDCEVTPTCGLADEHKIIGFEDTPSNFFLPERLGAKLLWSSSGFVEYKIGLPQEYEQLPKELMITFEACSEAPNFKEDWKSDITIWINSVAVGTFRSPGDYGLRRGKLNPAWWDDGVSQHGDLITITINAEHTIINSKMVSEVGIGQLNLDTGKPLVLRIGNDKNAKYIGGFNIFGSAFGDYNLDIEFSFVY
jgi:predicted transcriptional regulator